MMMVMMMIMLKKKTMLMIMTIMIMVVITYFSIAWQEPADRLYGAINETGHWVGMVGDVARGVSEFSDFSSHNSPLISSYVSLYKCILTNKVEEY